MFPKTFPKLKKNTNRHLDKKTVEKVLERDEYDCACCGTSFDLDPPHHAWYGIEANHGPNRNDADQLVTICRSCHYDIHSKGDTEKRERCKNYLLSL